MMPAGVLAHAWKLPGQWAVTASVVQIYESELLRRGGRILTMNVWSPKRCGSVQCCGPCGWFNLQRMRVARSQDTAG